MIYIWCYALCRALHTLDHTDAKALVVCRELWLWHWCGLSEGCKSSCSSISL
jgi:hypothetical protein